MDFKITGRHIDITPAIHDYARSKVERLTRYYDRIQEITVVIDHPDARRFEVEIIVDLEHADDILARSDNEDLYASIDGAVDKATRQLTDHKEKLRNRKHNV